MTAHDRTLVPATDLPAPAPLPSLPTAFSRRATLFGSLAATGFLAAAGAASAAALPALAASNAEPIVDMYRTVTALQAYAARPDVSEDDADEAGEKACDLKVEAFDLRATTPAGALASLQWARDEFSRYYVEVADPDWLDRFTLKLMDNALIVLKAGGVNV